VSFLGGEVSKYRIELFCSILDPRPVFVVWRLSEYFGLFLIKKTMTADIIASPRIPPITPPIIGPASEDGTWLGEGVVVEWPEIVELEAGLND